MLMSALAAGFVAMVMSDQQAGGLNRDQTQAYAAAHAGLEKLTADLGDLFVGGNYSPDAATLATLEAAPPTVPGFTFVGPTTAYAFMQAMGLVNDHVDGCWVRERAERARSKIPASLRRLRGQPAHPEREPNATR